MLRSEYVTKKTLLDTLKASASYSVKISFDDNGRKDVGVYCMVLKEDKQHHELISFHYRRDYFGHLKVYKTTFN